MAVYRRHSPEVFSFYFLLVGRALVQGELVRPLRSGVSTFFRFDWWVEPRSNRSRQEAIPHRAFPAQSLPHECPTVSPIPKRLAWQGFKNPSDSPSTRFWATYPDSIGTCEQFMLPSGGCCCSRMKFCSTNSSFLWVGFFQFHQQGPTSWPCWRLAWFYITSGV